MNMHDPFPENLLLIGCGAMAGAMLSRWIEVGLPADQVTVVRPSGARAGDGVRVVTSVPDMPPPSVILLGVKPAMIDDVAPAVARVAGSSTVIVSILAGIDIGSLRRRFPAAASIVRAMPNLPVAIGAGVVALHADRSDERLRAMIGEMMTPLGLVEWIADEAMFDAVTALAGSGPAFLYRFIDALARGGATLGLSRDASSRLALATVAGAGRWAAAATDPPAVLADRVASRGGSTRAGLDILDHGNAIDDLMLRVLTASEQRNRELGAAARAPDVPGPDPSPRT